MADNCSGKEYFAKCGCSPRGTLAVNMSLSHSAASVGLWGSNVQFFSTEGKRKKFGVDLANYTTTKILKMCAV